MTSAGATPGFRGHGDQGVVRAGELLRVTGDQLQRLAGVGAAQQFRGDLSGGLQPPLPLPCRLVQPGVVDGDPGRAGQRLQHHLVVVGEALATVLLGQVQPAEGLLPGPDRHPDEGPHRRMVRREPDRHRVLREIVQAQRFVVLDDHPQHPAAGRQRPDQLPGGVVDADIDELAQHSALADHPQRAVSGVDQVDRGLHDLPQRGVQLQSGRHGQHGVQQRVHPVPGAGDDVLDPVLHLDHQLPQPVWDNDSPTCGRSSPPVWRDQAVPVIAFVGVHGTSVLGRCTRGPVLPGRPLSRRCHDSRDVRPCHPAASVHVTAEPMRRGDADVVDGEVG